MITGATVHITGIVQGVGFRPFVYNLAVRYRLTGWVRNTSAGVDIEVDGAKEALESFIKALQVEAPALARIDEFKATWVGPFGYSKFEIVHSEAITGAFQPISPDVAICDDCLRELFDPKDRRFRYPFINCTNCGPRFTIIKDIPYDRLKTTMAGFELCTDCAREYRDPTDRRFHAQPVACPVCGPQVWWETTKEIGKPLFKGNDAILEARKALGRGEIVAIKGLGGFHLACDAINVDSVIELRKRKLRVDKPFALMLPDIETIEKHCYLDDTERALLISPARPIVLLQRKPESKIVKEVAPRQESIGVMLPYTPLHYLLLERSGENFEVLVMTSGNLSEEPIATDNEEARQRLSSLADAFLMHDRDIYTRCDDSVVRGFHGQTFPIRRSRGYAPFPVKLSWQTVPLLATGAELKNTFCITHDNYAFLSHHIGDMENYETLRSFEQSVQHFERLFRVKPVALVHDLHPNYLATRYAIRRSEDEKLPLFGVQHHHAHIAACMAENRLDGSHPIIGVAFDGTGYGDDGAIWGGEFLIADYKNYKRFIHLDYFPLPGGDSAIKHPARTALAMLWSLGMDWDERFGSVSEFSSNDQATLRTQLERRINTPLTSSVGRLFDAVAALAGVRQKVNYEAQAAIEFEALADKSDEIAYPFDLDQTKVVFRSTFEHLIADILAGIPINLISARFHNGLAQMVVTACSRLKAETGINEVALSGGVWQNITLLGRTLSLLRNQGFQVYIHTEVPANDGGLSLGQVVIADSRMRD
jgi:hydrogenase maturation protein HypF